MTNTNQNNINDNIINDNISQQYFISVFALIVVFPVVLFLSECFIFQRTLSFAVFAKWFIFSAAGLRLFVAGLKQAINPSFTARQIFHIESTDSYPILRELGFANICLGLLGISSLFKPEWRLASAFASGLYYGIAGFQHLLRKPVSKNEYFALWTDLLVFIVLLICFVFIPA
jgi:hypothetical protein